MQCINFLLVARTPAVSSRGRNHLSRSDSSLSPHWLSVSCAIGSWERCLRPLLPPPWGSSMHGHCGAALSACCEVGWSAHCVGVCCASSLKGHASLGVRCRRATLVSSLCLAFKCSSCSGHIKLLCRLARICAVAETALPFDFIQVQRAASMCYRDTQLYTCLRSGADMSASRQTDYPQAQNDEHTEVQSHGATPGAHRGSAPVQRALCDAAAGTGWCTLTARPLLLMLRMYRAGRCLSCHLCLSW